MFLRDTEMWIIIIWMRAIVDYPVHVQVQVVKLRDLNKKELLAIMSVPVGWHSVQKHR